MAVSARSTVVLLTVLVLFGPYSSSASSAPIRGAAADRTDRELMLQIGGSSTSRGKVTAGSSAATKKSGGKPLQIGGRNNQGTRTTGSRSSRQGNIQTAAKKALLAISKLPFFNRVMGPFTSTLLSGSSQLPLDDVTIFLPLRPLSLYQAYNNMTNAQQLQLAAYHLVTSRMTFRTLREQASNTELYTLEGNSIVKQGGAFSPLIRLKDRSSLPAIVLWPNLYVTDKFAVHGISKMMFPKGWGEGDEPAPAPAPEEQV